MDQAVSTLGKEGRILLLDCRCVTLCISITEKLVITNWLPCLWLDMVEPSAAGVIEENVVF